jgi:broad specificity phosphatase PhoE
VPGPVTDLLVVRHGQSEWNEAGRWQGWADPPLSSLGEDQARAAALALADTALDAVASSDLQRARRTAEIISEELGLGPVDVEPDLRERGVGEFSGLTSDEIEERWPGLRQAWRERRIEIPGGEPDALFLERILRGLHALAERHRGQRVLLVAHGGAIRTVRMHLGGEPGGLDHLGGLWLHLADGAWRRGESWLAS